MFLEIIIVFTSISIRCHNTISFNFYFLFLHAFLSISFLSVFSYNYFLVFFINFPKDPVIFVPLPNPIPLGHCFHFFRVFVMPIFFQQIFPLLRSQTTTLHSLFFPFAVNLVRQRRAINLLYERGYRSVMKQAEGIKPARRCS